MLKTYENFKSLDAKVKDANVMDDLVGGLPDDDDAEMLKTHENFKSYDPKVKDANDMDDLVGDLLNYDFAIRVPLWEMGDWQRDEIIDFKIDLENVDRLYYIRKDATAKWDMNYNFVGRMDYHGKSVFIAFRVIRNLDLLGDGILLISADANYFIRSIISTANPNMAVICRALVYDGLNINRNIQESEKYYRAIVRQDYPFNWEFGDFEHEKIKETIIYYHKFLPYYLRDKLKDFVIFAKNKIQLYDYNEK